MLEKIKGPEDIKNIPEKDLPQLAQEIREFLIESVSRTGGHLASNLGVVELTIALHRVYNLPEDKLIWDVGHQSYTHKILTGRKEEFSRLRQEGGISGFPRRNESRCDSLDTGHSSTSISAGLGYVKARELTGAKYSVVSVIGDGALTGGLAFEAINNMSDLHSNMVIVLNDNEMSISENVGGISEYLSGIRTSNAYVDLKEEIQDKLGRLPGGGHMIRTIRRTKNSIKQLVVPGMFFEDIGITYLGPVNGHNIPAMERLFKEAKSYPGPVLVHVITQKGRGYVPAMRHPDRFHGTGAFDIETGLPLKEGKACYQDIFSTVLKKIGERNEQVCAITAAMKEGTGLRRFANQFPDRFFDVGIAEEHAVSFAAGLALGGKIPVFAVYSSFLQRAYDQIMEDVCLQNLHVVFAIDRAGFVGADGATHNGCFDLSYLNMMPGMTILAPKNKWELSDMMKFAVETDGPVAVRYPRGEAWTGLEEFRSPIETGRAEVIKKGQKVALLAIGSMVKNAMETADILEKHNIKPTVVNMRFVKPFDRELVRKLAESHDLLVTMEENVRIGGMGQQILDFIESERLPVEFMIRAVPDAFIHHAVPERQRKKAGLDPESTAKAVLEKINA
ncbi:MAG: 1-deoxy-D-xylulose-5-phosphate synthase [Eubacterium sp.]|nr:1-deoxy-D-xylulose-5-phosphate synthase [Eubacterium sp.]